MAANGIDTQKKIEEVRASLVNNYLPCPVAFQIARRLKIRRRQVGNIANRLKIRIIDCQLGCFQLEKATHDDLNDIKINETLGKEIETSTVNGRLPCAVALRIASRLKVTPKEVGDAATRQKTKIINCQLGCFQ